MMKRVLSFLLCLIMVVGLAAPSVQASSIGNSPLPDILDDICIPEGTDGTVIVNGEDVTQKVKDNAFDKLPSPGEMTTPTAAPSAPVVVDLCKCADLSSAEDHPGVCKVKAPYIELCNTASEPELYEKWVSYNHEEQTLMQEYLRENLPLKLVALEKLLSTPTGSASEKTTDGTTVKVEGIPEYSSLTVTEATDEVKEIVDEYVAERGKGYTELFTYDVSVQDVEGKDWQPDFGVQMELELPGEKLHRYSKVYVVHVDDNGVASTIEAEVTEDGKIAFETPGFSTFSGFTVDFEYDGTQFSINGMESIKLSELFEKLKMPLNAEDVSDVSFSNSELIKVEKLEGDWNLVSLMPFASVEKLTVTMNDGEIFEIKVTDAHRAIVTLYNDYGTVTNWDLEANSSGTNNGVVTMYMDHSYKPECEENSYGYEHHWVIDGEVNGVEGGVLQIDLQQRTGYDYNNGRYYQNLTNVYWGIRTMKIVGGAKVVIRLGADWDNNETITFRSLTNKPMFDIQSGSLYFNLESSDFDLYPGDGFSENTGDGAYFTSNANTRGVKIIIDGYYNGKNQATNKQCSFFYLGKNAKNLAVNDVTFSNNDFRAVNCYSDFLNNLRFRDCTFESSVKYLNGGGGVIRINDRTKNVDYPENDDLEVQVQHLGLYGCTFNGNEAATTLTNTSNYDGGVLCCYGNLDNTTIQGCTFTNCKVKGRGGAISIGRGQTSYSMGNLKVENCTFTGCEAKGSLGGAVSIRDGNFNYIWFEGCTFSGTKAASHGGAVDISLGDDPALIQSYVKFNSCTFSKTTAAGNGGGALRLLLSGEKPVTISNCSFSDTSANTHGGAIYFPEAEAAVLGDVDITDCTFSKDVAKAYGGAICVYSRTATLDITGGSFADCKAGTVVASSGAVDALGNQHYNGNGGGGAIMITRKHGAINIGGTSTKKQTFTNCESLNNGGAIAFEGTTNPSTEIQSCNIQYVEIDGCKARDSGSAICMSTATIVNMSIKDSVIKNCTYVSGYTGTEANKNSLYDELYTKDMPYGDVPFRTNDSHGTIRTNGALKAQLVVEGVTFTNNTSVTGGGGIYWNANRVAGYDADTDGPYTFTNSLAIKNCTFEDNYAFRDGGAIYVEASLSVEGGIFKNNSAQRGGAIAQQIYNNPDRPIQTGETNNLIIKSYTSGSTTTKSVFDENYARTHGGAISVLCNATGAITTTEDAAAMPYPITCEILGAEIKNNRAAENGGGVYFYQMTYPADHVASDYIDPVTKQPMTEAQKQQKIKLDNKEVEGYVKSLKLDGSTIFGNYSGCGKTKLTTPESANGSGHGGGIYLNAKKQTTLQVLGCTVYSNTAHYGNGGGVYMSGEGGVCQIKSNAAGLTTEIGGAANKGNKATSSAPGTTAGQNTGNGGGIGIFIKGRIEMQGGTVSYNTAETSGGGIAVNGSTMEFTDGIVTNNAAKYGGGISLTNSGDPTTIADQSLKNPPALTPAWGMVFTNGTVTNNVADIGGGICISNNSTMKLDGGKVNVNYAATKSGTSYSYEVGQHGGGIAVVSGSKMNIYAGEVKSNHAGRGGGITVQGGSGLQMLPKAGSTAAGTVYGNTVHSGGGGYGGGIYLAPKASGGSKNTLYVDHGTIEANKGYKGAGIALMEESEATLSGGKIYKNVGVDTNTLGGGAYLYGGKLTISGAELSYNYGQSSGGAVYLTTASGSIPAELSVTGGTIHHNHTRTGWGGGIYMLGQGCVTTVSGGKIYENYTEVSGSNGGGINAEHSCTLNINGGEIYSNRAASDGGGINAHSSAVINIDGGEIYKNTAASSGGGINAYSSTTINIDGGAIYQNTAASNGGGINTYTSTTVNIDGGAIYQNTATAGTGGGIYAYYYTTMTITGGDIYSNKAATYGGGMHVSDHSTLTFKGGDIRDNTATRKGGGGITVSWHSNATVGTSADGKKIGKIMNNTAAMGGGLYVECSSLTVRNGYIINNKAVGQPASNVKTAYHLAAESLVGIGGGICLTGSSSAKGTFTLTGDKIAIYGNTADFAADDVFSNGQYTQLDIPTVVQMDLADYDFQAEGWVEDYCKDDTHYTSGLNMINLHADRAPAVDQEAIRNMGVTRFRNTPSTNRKYMLVEPEYVSGKYPNNTAVSGVYANQANAYVCLTLGIPGAADDTVVLDYGTTVNVNLIDNDLFINAEDFQYGELGLGIPNGVNEKYGIHYSSAKNANGSAVDHLGTFSGTDLLNNELSNGIAFLNSNTGIITYNYNYGNGQLSFKKTETFAYTVKHGSSWFYAKITVVPATTIYYEDTAAQVTYHTGADADAHLAIWEPVGHSSGAAQEQDRPGAALIGSLDADNVYGYDGLRANTSEYSDGGAHLVTVSHEHNAEDGNNDGFCDKCNHALLHDWVDIKIEEGSKKTDGRCDVCGAGFHLSHDDTCTDIDKNWFCDFCGKRVGRGDNNARATFTFTGTGFDIVSACSAKTGILMVNVYKGTAAGLDYNNPDDRYVTTYMVDTYFGHTYDSTTGDWVQNPNSQAFLYQVPVIKADLTKVMTAMDDPNTPNQNEAQYANYGYGTYTVEIYVAPSFLPREHGYYGADFYLDAIRIYNPAGAGNAIDSKALETYKNDNEAWPAYAEVRNMLIEAKNLDIENNDGILYIDGASTNKISTYETRGPNNEVYLKPGHHIAFKMDMSNYGQDVTGIHMAMKGVAEPGHVLVQVGTSGGQKTTVQDVALSTTDMYYDIGKDSAGNFIAKDKVITITNNGERVISITTVKVTHGSKPDKNSRLSGLFQSNLMTSYVALDMLDAKELAEPSVTPKYPALSYNGMICYNVFFSAEDLGSLTADDLGLAVFDSYDPEGTVETAKDVIMGATQIDGLYMVATKGVNAKYLGDTQYFRAFAKQADGSFVYSKMVSYSAVDYAKNVLAKSDDVKLKQLVVAMLNYGAEAQKFFGYKTDDLMNKDLTADDQALLAGFDASSLNGVQKVDPAKVGDFASTGGFTRRSPAISFNGAFEINYFFTPAHAPDGDMVLCFWNEDTYNSVTELTYDNADKIVEVGTKDGTYTATSDEIIARQLDQTLYVAAIYRSCGETYCSGVLPYSIAAYCQKPPAGVQALATAAAIYGCTAKQFFGE